MKRITATLTLRALLPFTIGSTVANAQGKDHEADVVIYGPTSAAIAAAVQVKRMGKTVIVVGPDKRLGGLSAGGLGWTPTMGLAQGVADTLAWFSKP